MLRFVKQKLLHKKWMVICLLIGNVLLVAVAGSNPMYQNAALQKALNSKLLDMIIKENKNPSEVSFSASVRSGNSKELAAYEKVNQMSKGLADSLGVEQLYNVQLHSLSKMRAKSLMQREDNKRSKTIQVCAMSGLEEHVNILSGEMYKKEVSPDGVFEAIISQRAMVKLNFIVGETIELSSIKLKNGEPMRVKIVGIFENNKQEDPYWSSSPSDYFMECFIDEGVFENSFINMQNQATTINTKWSLIFDYKKMTPGQVDSFISECERISEAYSSKSTAFKKPQVLSALRDYQTVAKKTVATLLILQAPVFALLLAFIFMISRQMLDLEQNEIAILKSRGSGQKQILIIYILQSLLLSGISFIIGLPLGIFLCQTLGSTNGFLEFIQRKAIYITLDWRVLFYTFSAVLCSVAFMVLPVMKAAGISIVGVKQNKSRKKKNIFERVYADVLLLLLSIYGLYSFNSQSELLVTQMLQGESLDPFLFLCASLFIISASLVSLRIQPLFIHLIYVIGKKHWKPAFFASFLQILRTRQKQQFMMVFLMLTLALGIFNATVARTILSNSEKGIRYTSGSDIIVKEKWNDNSIYLENNPNLALTYYEPDFSVYQTLQGVESAAKVRVDNEIVTDINGKQLLPTVMSIDTKEFGQTIRFQDGLLPIHINHYLNTLGSSIDGVLLSKNFLDHFNIKIGDTIPLNNKGKEGTTCTVLGFVDYWPGYTAQSYEVSDSEILNKKDNYLVIANYAKIKAAFGSYPYEIWIKNKDSSQYMYEYAEKKNISFVKFEDVNARLVDVKNEPLFQGTNGILTMSFIVILILCCAGFLIYWILSIRQRELLFGVFRAMGMTKKEVIQMLINEQVFSSGVSIMVGTLLGFLASKWFIPLVQIFYASTEQTVPLEVVRETMDMVRLFCVIAIVIIICMVVLGKLISRIRISQALKLGED